MRRDWEELRGVELHMAVTHRDLRGTFAKHYESAQPSPSARQICSSFNRVSGTVRGLHVQVPPHGETKLVWCTSGELWDVLVDTRFDQPTYGSWTAVHLTADGGHLLAVPPGLAHGYQTLVDDTSVAYVIDGEYAPAAARTLAWDDPTIGVSWPLDVTIISENDRNGTKWPLSC